MPILNDYFLEHQLKKYIFQLLKVSKWRESILKHDNVKVNFLSCQVISRKVAFYAKMLIVNNEKELNFKCSFDYYTYS